MAALALRVLAQLMQNLIDSAKRQLTGNKQTVEQLRSKAGLPAKRDSQVFQAFQTALAEWDAKVGLSAPGNRVLLPTLVFSDRRTLSHINRSPEALPQLLLTLQLMKASCHVRT